MREQSEPGKKNVQDPFSGCGRILVMDDEAIMGDLAEAMLHHLGYDAEVAENGERSVVLYEQAKNVGRPFHAVILDLTVRDGMGGLDAMKELLRIDPRVRAVVSSGYSCDPAILEYERYGFKAALSKPYQMENLREVLFQVFGK